MKTRIEDGTSFKNVLKEKQKLASAFTKLSVKLSVKLSDKVNEIKTQQNLLIDMATSSKMV